MASERSAEQEAYDLFVAARTGDTETLALILSPYHSVPKGGTRGAPCPGLAPVTHNGVASAVVKLPATRAHAPCLPPGAVPPRR